ncbi:hypothetical protein DSCA_54970 [Desulfosarcina alkanivorans]|uniref:ABC transporter substrate-binding protein n=1 Tax=Desulfosarcina alkanivorans TaxID=571177 RepID=A0A5K7Z4L2_9BACT|nr:ABC transporter substrate binding protein [Desulfosarcina alkanivorans]BBO71567.1 hypothetical protein DSCA_54970 [Desulfosarcina alkanivorans]
MKRLLSLGMSLVTAAVMVTSANASPYAGKKVLFIDSYHSGYAWSDGITTGVQRTLADTGVDLKVIHMDTKRNTDEAFKKEAALKAKTVIEQFKPDVVIAADDNASQYLIQPYYEDASLPFVFCGVNWDEKGYGFPYNNVTGMVEVTPIPQLLEQLQPLAKGDKIGFLGPDILTARKEAQNYKKVFGMTLTEYYAKDFEDWKKGFAELQAKVDILVIDSDGGLYKTQADEMKQFVEDNTKIPSGATYDFMAPYALITYGKVAEEQGDWSAGAALKILAGDSPKDIPVAKNSQGKLIVNTRIASKAGTDVPFDILQSAEKVIE